MSRAPSAIGLIADEISRALNKTYPADMQWELVDRRRIDKIGEEFGEVIEALNGMWSENPRKGRSHELQDVVRELLDVALCALAATAHMTGHSHDVGALLDQHATRVRDRLLAAIESHPVHPCCDLHGRNCEPPSELCCGGCTEGAHPGHRDGSACSDPDLSGSGATIHG